MHKQFFLSDPHLNHENILSFLDDKGEIVRPFKSIEEHDNFIVDNCNKVVRAVDRLYFMGDVAMNRRALPILGRINGRKVLIKGNHDIFPLKDYTKYFQDIRAYKIYPEFGAIFSHIPIHPSQLEGRFKWNFHGHLHEKTIPDERYINLCVEHTNYTPVDLDFLIENYFKK